MPPILRRFGFRFFFYSDEGNEPPHVHVEHAEGLAKFWLLPVSLAKSRGLDFRALTKVRRLVESNQHAFLRSWHDHFPS